ncbi:hypothetical protein G6F42_028803 [Rhizopus arrhizus]|nr:hypothetical protein G6F42_028803 [Rhizopus arrhizus]
MSAPIIQVKLPPGIKVFSKIADFRQWRRSLLLDQKTLGYVPTMGALHQGHLALGKIWDELTSQMTNANTWDSTSCQRTLRSCSTHSLCQPSSIRSY